jgi:hypothetical protein
MDAVLANGQLRDVPGGVAVEADEAWPAEYVGVYSRKRESVGGAPSHDESAVLDEDGEHGFGVGAVVRADERGEVVGGGLDGFYGFEGSDLDGGVVGVGGGDADAGSVADGSGLEGELGAGVTDMKDRGGPGQEAAAAIDA